MSMKNIILLHILSYLENKLLHVVHSNVLKRFPIQEVDVKEWRHIILFILISNVKPFIIRNKKE